MSACLLKVKLAGKNCYISYWMLTSHQANDSWWINEVCMHECVSCAWTYEWTTCVCHYFSPCTFPIFHVQLQSKPPEHSFTPLCLLSGRWAEGRKWADRVGGRGERMRWTENEKDEGEGLRCVWRRKQRGLTASATDKLPGERREADRMILESVLRD